MSQIDEVIKLLEKAKTIYDEPYRSFTSPNQENSERIGKMYNLIDQALAKLREENKLEPRTIDTKDKDFQAFQGTERVPVKEAEDGKD